MVSKKTLVASDPEIVAIAAVYDALRELESAAQKRVLDYVSCKLNLTLSLQSEQTGTAVDQQQVSPIQRQVDELETDDDSDGISPVALKWMKRSGFTASGLSSLFSLGVDEIDLVAKKVPGDGKKQRMHNVLLLKGIAAYLATGAPRVSHEQLKEACLHYDAFDNTNFAAYLKSFVAEASGSKESGYTLTARGLTSATELIRTLIAPGS